MADVSTLPSVELGVLGPLQVRQDGATVTIPGAKPRAILTMLGLHNGSVVSADTLIALLWGDDPPRTAAKALQTHISSLRRALGDGVVVTEGTGWTLQGPQVDATRYKSAAKAGRDAAAAGDTSQAVARFEEALALWRGIPELPEGRRGTSEKTRWIEGYAALVEDRADALLATGRAAELIGELESAVADAPLRERRWGQLMLALYRAGRQGEALGAYQRARALLVEELGVDPGPDLRRLEAAIVAQDSALETPAVQHVPAVTRAVTFLLTDIEGSTAAWEADADAMAVALARHDELVEQVVTSRGGRLIKTRGEGDATFSVFERPSAAAAAAIELQEAITGEPWALREPMRIRVALHTGEVEFRDGDYFGRAVNRAARLRSLAAGGQILCSGATAELVIDSLPDDVVLADLGTRELRNLARPERVFELRLESADDLPQPASTDAPLERPILPPVLAGPGPFVGRGHELAQLFSAWQTALAGATNAMLIAGEPGVGKTRLAGEWSRQAYDQGALVIYGRCDEDLGAPYQPFAEALRSLVPCLGASKLRGLRGVEALLTLVPGLADVVSDLPSPTRADPDTERYALFDAVVAVLGLASSSVPVVLILDDLHWAAKPTLLLLRHLLRFGEQDRVQIIGTYRSTDLDRSHPLAAMLADLHRDGTATRIQLSGLDESDVTAYVAEAGYHDEELARALASVTGGNPFFLIEALRHVDESGGQWDPSTLPQGVREAVSRRLSRLPVETNKALAAAAVVGSRFALELVEHVVGDDLVDAFDEACKAGIVIEEPGGRYRFNHALVRQSLLAELPSVRRMRLHQRIAATLEDQSGADDELLAELAHHYFECAWAGNAAKAVSYCQRAADQAMARLAYEGAADLYDRALHALEEIDDELPDRDEQVAVLLVARCEALLAAGDVASAAGAVSQLQEATRGSVRLAAWAACFDGQLSMLIHPDRLDEVEAAVGAAADKLAELDDTAGEAKAHTVRATCLARLGRIGDCEIALDDALTSARHARDHRRVNAVLGNAPLAALWGPNPVPRAGGRCLDVVRLLRITTDSPAVEATSTRCQAVLEAFRGRAAAARRMIDSARRTVTELGLRHALLEVEQFAGIVELVVDDAAAAEPHLRQAYNGFRRMGLEADTAETAALLGRTCLALNREDEADELCTESERLAGHALKASIAWRTLRAQLLSRGDAHDEARLVAEAAVSRAERTDALVDHGDACLALATVLDAAGDARGARAAAERAADLYERKGAAALVDKARSILGERDLPSAPVTPEAPIVELDNACVQAIRRVQAAVNREAWDEFEELHATDVFIDSRRKIVGFTRDDLTASELRRSIDNDMLRFRTVVIAVRGERLALTRLEMRVADVSPGAPHDEMLQLCGLDENGRMARQVWFDVEDVDAAIAELDAQHARFEEVQPRAPLENAASRADDRFNTLFTERRWDAIGALLTDDVKVEDRRRGLRREGNDRATELAELQAIADLGTKTMTSYVLAIRGERLALVRTLYSGRDQRPEAFHTEVLRIAEIDADERIGTYVAFDPDDFQTAVAELDARYLAGEASAHARTWSVITGGHAALNRNELPPTAPDCVSIDHRRGAAFAPGELTAYFRAGFDLDQDIRTYIEIVHRLSDLGAVCTHAAHGVSREGFDAEWRGVDLLTVEGDMVNRCEVFDEADLDAALAKFEQLSPTTRRLENAASQVAERFSTHFAARDWGAIAEMLADDISTDDRRQVVGAGLRQGRDAVHAELSAVTEIGVESATSDTIATRGEHLVLNRARTWGRDQRPGAFLSDMLSIVEINGDEQITALITFDLDDFDAAIAELDARYFAGEAAAHSHTWSLIAGAFAAINRHELPELAPGWVNIDHRRGPAFATGDMTAYLTDLLDDTPDIKVYIEVVHRLSSLGAVITQAAHGTSQQGFRAEWREIGIFTFDGDLLGRYELFDDADLATALAKFEQLSRPAPHLESAASQVAERFLASFAARDWDAMAELLADDVFSDDRRAVIGAGIRTGPDAVTVEMRANADLWITKGKSTIIATRGEHLALMHARFSGSDQEPQAFLTEILAIGEIDADERIVAIVVFDLDDFEAAIAELDARYLAGEAAPHARTWSVIMQGFASLNRRELPPTTPDWVNIDHRRGTSIAPGEMFELLSAAWNLTSDLSNFVAVVHRLDNLGGVVTHVANETSRQGFHAEWRVVSVFTVEGDMVNRCEVFDEAAIDAALARFEELHPQTRRLENAASRTYARLQACFANRDWDAMAEILADGICTEDRRRVVNSGLRQGRDAVLAELSAITEIGVKNHTSDIIAIRGEHLVLSRARSSGRDQRPEAFHTEVLDIVEVDGDGKVVSRIAFDPDDFGAAIAELDARYVAGEAAPYARTWSAIARAYATITGRELAATTPDWVNIDHRRAAAFAPGEANEYIHAAWDLTKNLNIYVEDVYRLSDLGAVVAHAARGTSLEGFDAEWRATNIFTVEGDKISRTELFDEADVDAVIAKFEQLSSPAPQLENAATRVYEHLHDYFEARDWNAIANILADNYSQHDRRPVVGGEIRGGRDALLEDLRAAADLGVTTAMSHAIATRGERVVLTLAQYSRSDEGPEAFQVLLQVAEIDADERIAGLVAFDLDDIDAAFEELDARYLAGEAAAYAHTWSVIAGACASIARHELPPTTPDWVNLDHRRGIAFAPGDLTAYIRALWDHERDVTTYIEAVRQLNDVGAVFVQVLKGSSQDGFDAEWRIVELMTVDGDLINRAEFFDENESEAGLAKFEQLSRPTPRLENAASQVFERFLAHFTAGDWDAMAELLADRFSSDDRRRVVGAGIRHGRDAQIADMRAIADLGITNVTPTVMATRGGRLLLIRVRFSDRDQAHEAFLTEALGIVEINADERIVALISIDIDDVDAAFEELETRYIAGEAAAHAQMWSLVADAFAAINRHQIPATTPNYVIVDHQLQHATIGAAVLTEYLNASWDLTPDLRMYIEAVHRLTDVGAVITLVLHGTSPEGFDADWRIIELLTGEGDVGSRCEVFGEADLDAALARFEELQPPTPRLENTASQVGQRYRAHFAEGNWDAMADIIADDFVGDDRRRVVGSGVRIGREAQIADMRAIADLFIANMTWTDMATRGDRLVLFRVGFLDRDQKPDAFRTEVLCVAEIDADERIVASVSFDLDDVDAAFEELDARYLAGEAADHAHTWSVVSNAYAAMNRHELFGTTPDWVNVDHRRPRIIEEGGLNASLRSLWKLIPDVNFRVEAVHRLSDLGAVCTHAAHGVSEDGFDAEWRGIELITVEGQLINRCEIFDEADLDIALARFEELQRLTPRLENAASRADERFWMSFAAREWAAMAELVADNISTDDRRRAVNAGIRHGRDDYMADMRAIAEVLPNEDMTSTAMATRGARLALTRIRGSHHRLGADEISTEVLSVVEIDPDNRVESRVGFDLDNIDAAFAELDARYIAREAGAHSQTWSVIARAYTAINRHELPATTPDWVNTDHRRGIAFAPGDATAYLRASQDPQGSVYIETVHRLSNLGAVFTWAGYGTSQDGFEAEWRGINVLTVEGDLINRGEIFDEADIDAALARFEELGRPARRLENKASRAGDRFFAYFGTRNWAAIAEILADGSFVDDRRRVVNAGFWDGRDVVIANMRALEEGGANITSTVVATRGERLALTHICSANRDQRQGEFGVEMLGIAEIDTDERIAAHVLFDVDDIDAAFAELDARYLAGEAAAHSHAWSVNSGFYAGFNRHELPATTPDWIYIDHRPLVTIEANDLPASMRAIWDLAPDISIYMEAVHRLSDLGAVVTAAVYGSSQEGFDAEWRMIDLFTVEGDLISRCEIFDEADLDAALARFEELHSQTRRLENAATRALDRFFARFRAHDWAAIAETLTDDSFVDDRNPVVNVGFWDGREAVIANLRALEEAGANITSTAIATRGERLALALMRSPSGDLRYGEFDSELLIIVEIDTADRITAQVVFNCDGIDAAFAELDARYLAGEAADHSRIWSVVADGYAAFNRHELRTTTPDYVVVDHRLLVTIDASDEIANIRATWELMPDISIHIEAVHRLSGFGALVSITAHGTTPQGFDAEWRLIQLLTLEGDLNNRCELFDELDLDAALARFEELQPRAPRLENAASRVIERLQEYFAARNWAAIAENSADEIFTDDRRSVVGSGILGGRDLDIANIRAAADLGSANLTSTTIATRGERLVLARLRMSGRDQRPDAFHREMLLIVEIDADNRVTARILFDLNDIDVAFEELDRRYLAGEAADHAPTWLVITRACAAFNRHELAATTPDSVYLDHRRGVSVEAVDLDAFTRATWDITPDVSIYIEAVHSLNDLGAVVTHTARGISHDGFDAEWRMVDVYTVDGDLISRNELFDEADLDAALARFEELQSQAPRLENAASKLIERFQADFAARNWAAIAENSAEDIFTDDRRSVVGSGFLAGRDLDIANIRAAADLGSANFSATVIATRGEHLVLARLRMSGRDQRPEAFHSDMLGIVEVDADSHVTARILFDLNDIDAAFEELDRRYLAGEAAAHAPTWSVIARTYAGFNRHELPAKDWRIIDHRSLVGVPLVSAAAIIRSVWDLAPDLSIQIEAVHRLSGLGAVIALKAYGTSPEGFDAEWRMIQLPIVKGDRVDGCEVFDETDLDAALARFEELQPQAPRLENAASQVAERFLAHFAAGGWDAMAEILADNLSNDDRRRVVGAGIRHGRDAQIADMRAVADVWATNVTSTVIATRGGRLALMRLCFSSRDQGPERFVTEPLTLVEINADERVVGIVSFDLDDVNAAFEELDARYLAGEAADHVHAWSVIAQTSAAFNRHELPVADWVVIDHRRLAPIDTSDLPAAIRAIWDLTPDLSTRIEAVHRLSSFGAVVTYTAHGTSTEGFAAEWRVVDLLTVEGDRISRFEFFDEADLAAALARFDELSTRSQPK